MYRFLYTCICTCVWGSKACGHRGGPVMNIAGRTMRKAALSLGRGGSATPLAAPKMAFVRLQNSEIRASKWKKAGKTANSGDFRNDRCGVPLQNGFIAKTVGVVGGRARAVSKRSTSASK